MSAKRFNSHINGLQDDADIGADNALIDPVLATAFDVSNSHPSDTAVLWSAALGGLSFDAAGAGGHGPGGGGGGGGGGKPSGSLPTTYTSGDPTVDDSQEFNIQINFSGKWTAEQQSLVIWAANAWSKVITGDIHDDLDLQGHLVDDITITVSIGRIDGSGDLLTGINTLATTGSIVTRDPGAEDQWLPLTASIKLDAVDLKAPELAGFWQAIIMHEIGHALGFAGPVFQQLGLLDGHNFIGGHAVAAYGRAVPLTDDNSHWIEPAFSSAGTLLPGSFSPGGTPLPAELMTTLFALGQQPVLSDTTVAVFEDLGYTVLDPSPSSAFVVLDNTWLV